MGELLRVLPDNWGASVLVVHENPDPVMVGLSPETVQGNDIVLYQLEEKCRTNTIAVLRLILSVLSAEFGPMDIEGLPICPQDTRITLSDGPVMSPDFLQSGDCGEIACGWHAGFEGTDTLAGDCLGPRHYWCNLPTPVL